MCRVETISDRRVQSNIVASAFILGRLVLEKEIIQTIEQVDQLQSILNQTEPPASEGN